ncbi:MAG: radical SAM protein [Deltaproteobacteria bacterium]|nr:radical SAM protein [Deltaproteobacteria bacterium]
MFCAQGGLDAEPPRPLADVRDDLARARRDHDAVTFVGGEPTLHPELPDIIAAARDEGFRAIGVQTNGRRLARASLVRLLADAGLTDVHLSIHGPSPAAHDYHTSVPGSFAAALGTLAAARASGLVVAVTTVLTRSNARGLGDLVSLLASRRASAWCLAVPHARGRAALAFDRVMPRLGVAMPFALHALSVAERVRLPAFVRGAPLCVLGPFARHALPEEPRGYGEPCASCAARSDCSGVDPRYLARFDGDELSPCEPVLRAPREEALAAMFVGVGEAAPADTSEVHPSPARARVALPMLGKVTPARAEVPRSAGRRAADALREIFPALYADGEPTE